MVELGIHWRSEGEQPEDVGHALGIVFHRDAVKSVDLATFTRWVNEGHESYTFNGDQTIARAAKVGWTKQPMGAVWQQQGIVPKPNRCYLIDTNIKTPVSLGGMQEQGLHPVWFQQLFGPTRESTTSAPLAGEEELPYWTEGIMESLVAYWVVEPVDAPPPPARPLRARPGPSTGTAATVLSSFGKPVRADRPRAGTATGG